MTPQPSNVRNPHGISLAVASLDLSPSRELVPWVADLRSHLKEREGDLKVHWAAVVGPGECGEGYSEFDTVIRLAGSADLGKAVNLLLSSIRSSHVLWADRSWRFEHPSGTPFCSASIGALEASSGIAQVKLHSDDILNFTDRSLYSGPVVEIGDVRFFVQSPRKIMFGLTLQPAISKVSALHDLGPLREGEGIDPGEVAAEYALRSTEREHHLALRSPEACPFVPVSGEPFKSVELVVEGASL